MLRLVEPIRAQAEEDCFRPSPFELDVGSVAVKARRIVSNAMEDVRAEKMAVIDEQAPATLLNQITAAGKVVAWDIAPRNLMTGQLDHEISVATERAMHEIRKLAGECARQRCCEEASFWERVNRIALDHAQNAGKAWNEWLGNSKALTVNNFWRIPQVVTGLANAMFVNVFTVIFSFVSVGRFVTLLGRRTIKRLPGKTARAARRELGISAGKVLVNGVSLVDLVGSQVEQIIKEERSAARKASEEVLAERLRECLEAKGSDCDVVGTAREVFREEAKKAKARIEKRATEVICEEIGCADFGTAISSDAARCDEMRRVRDMIRERFETDPDCDELAEAAETLRRDVADIPDCSIDLSAIEQAERRCRPCREVDGQLASARTALANCEPIQRLRQKVSGPVAWHDLCPETFNEARDLVEQWDRQCNKCDEARQAATEVEGLLAGSEACPDADALKSALATVEAWRHLCEDTARRAEDVLSQWRDRCGSSG